MEVRECKDVFYALQRFIEYSQEKHVEHAAKAMATMTRATPVVILYLAEIHANADALSRFAWVNEDTREARVYPRAGSAHYDVTLPAGGRPTCTCGATKVDRKLCEHIALVVSHTRPALSLQSLIFPEDTVERWRAQYTAAGSFNVPSVAELETHDQTELHKPLAIPRGRGAPKKKRKCGRRDAVKLYAKRMRREGGLAAVAVAPAGARAARGARGTSRSAAPAGAPGVHARGGKRARSVLRAGAAAAGVARAPPGVARAPPGVARAPPGVARAPAPPRTRR